MATSRITIFEQMLATDPDNTMIRFGLANEYLKAANYPAAINALEEYLRRANDEGAAYGMLARAYEQTGERESARTAYEKGIQVALAHNHPSMAHDYRMTLDLEYDNDDTL